MRVSNNPVVWLRGAFVSVLVCSCGGPQKPPSVSSDGVSEAKPAAAEVATLEPNVPALEKIVWADHGIADNGCFIVRDLDTNEQQVSDPERCAKGRRPNSTFKVVNALIGLDLGLLQGPDTIMVYDRERYPESPDWFDGWAQDQTLRDAMKRSAVPLFRKLALDIGKERMTSYLAKLEYGNLDMSGGEDSFWLQGGMRVTAYQQIDLITKLLRDELPASKSAQASLRDVLARDDIPDLVFFGKTGSGGIEDIPRAPGGPMVGWFIGWVDTPRGKVAFAMWVEGKDFAEMKARRLEVLGSVLRSVIKSRS